MRRGKIARERGGGGERHCVYSETWKDSESEREGENAIVFTVRRGKIARERERERERGRSPLYLQ